MAIVIFGLIAVGYYMTDLQKTDPSRMDFYNLHKAFGFTILILFFVRIALRHFSKLPAMPDSIKPNEIKLAKLGHFGLYALIFAVPFAGVVMSNSYGYGINYFGFEIAPFFPENKPLAEIVGEIHETLAYAMLGLVAVHAAAVLKHYLVDKTNLLNRIF